MSSLLHNSLPFQLSGIENFEDAKLLAKEHLDTYINGGIRLAWMMVTRIPPMIATEPKKHDPRFTILEACCDEDDACILVPLRPTLFFSYEGQVAAEGIVGTFPSKKLNAKGIMKLHVVYPYRYNCHYFVFIQQLRPSRKPKEPVSFPLMNFTVFVKVNVLSTSTDGLNTLGN